MKAEHTALLDNAIEHEDNTQEIEQMDFETQIFLLAYDYRSLSDCISRKDFTEQS